MRNKLSTVEWLALCLYFAGLVFVFVTKNIRVQLLFNLLAGALVCLDYFVLARQAVPSLSGARDDVKPKFRPSRLMWTGFALMVAALICSPRIRMSAVLMLSAFCFLVLDRYRKTSSIAVSK